MKTKYQIALEEAIALIDFSMDRVSSLQSHLDVPMEEEGMEISPRLDGFAWAAYASLREAKRIATEELEKVFRD